MKEKRGIDPYGLILVVGLAIAGIIAAITELIKAL